MNVLIEFLRLLGINKIFHQAKSALNAIRRYLSSQTILVIGDSHANVFYHSLFFLRYPKTFFTINSVGGATASGLENPNSKTQAYNIFWDQINSIDHERLIISLGEVDTGFVIWYRAQKYNTKVAPMLERAINSYQKFLKDILKRGAKPIVISTPLPTIEDDKSWGEVANLRKEIKATQKQRTELTLKFNSEMEKFCRSAKIAFISLDRECLGENGLVKIGMKNKNLQDHHYDRKLYAEMLCNKLESLI